jgi:hypothetical protein
MGKRDADIDLNQDNFHAVLEDEQDEVEFYNTNLIGIIVFNVP